MKRSRVIDSDSDDEHSNNVKKSKYNVNISVIPIPIVTGQSYCVDKTWVSASTTRNYSLKDPILDWLDEYYFNLMASNTNSLRVPIQNAIKSRLQGTSFTSFIMNQGNEFEKMIVEKLFKKFSRNIIDIGGCHGMGHSIELAEKTKKCIMEGVPFIYQGVLHDPDTKQYGVFDLAVRSDWLRNLVSIMPIETYNEIQGSPNIIDPITGEHVKWHYRIIDIKFTTLPLRSDGIHLLNSCSIKAYKVQVYIYNKIISKIQGYDSGIAYLLGRKWKYTCKDLTYKGDRPFDRLGRICFNTVDKDIPALTDDAVKWIRDMREHGNEWSDTLINCNNTTILPRVELYPNISNSCDFPWHDVKKRIANNLNEITLLWMCGPKNREAAFEKGIRSWSDVRCTSEAVNVCGKKTAKVLDEILSINKQSIDLVRPITITNNHREWKTNYPHSEYNTPGGRNRRVEFYVDMETISDVVSNVNTKCEYSNILFMIGVGYIDTEGVWKYRDFTLDELTLENERKMCEDFSHYIRAISNEYECDDPLLIHWSRAEPGLWDVVMNFENIKDSYDFDHPIHNISDGWFDLLTIFKDEPIVIKDCLSGFGLKDIASALYKHKLISTKWESTVTNGIDAMIVAYNAYQDAKSRKIAVKDINNMTEIIKYNEVDCKVLYEIITYIRNNH